MNDDLQQYLQQKLQEYQQPGPSIRRIKPRPPKSEAQLQAFQKALEKRKANIDMKKRLSQLEQIIKPTPEYDNLDEDNTYDIDNHDDYRNYYKPQHNYQPPPTPRHSPIYNNQPQQPPKREPEPINFTFNSKRGKKNVKMIPSNDIDIFK